jgi:hypothetical protein
MHEVWERLPLRQLRIALAAGVAGAAVYGLLTHRHAIVETLLRLHHVSPAWLALALASEAASLVVYALIVRRCFSWSAWWRRSGGCSVTPSSESQ